MYLSMLQVFWHYSVGSTMNSITSQYNTSPYLSSKYEITNETASEDPWDIVYSLTVKRLDYMDSGTYTCWTYFANELLSSLVELIVEGIFNLNHTRLLSLTLGSIR
jgi:hypothetical protein